jgi:hypothetical protein
VHVKRLLSVFRHGFHYGKTERNVGHKHTVHHVKVEPVALALIEHFDVALEVAEIGRKEGGRYYHNGEFEI